MENFDSVATLVEVPRLSIGLHNLTYSGQVLKRRRIFTRQTYIYVFFVKVKK